jgi:hypothetical protein
MRRATIFAVIVGVVAAFSGSALAKGAEEAQVEGKGLAAPIMVGGNGEPGAGSGLAALAEGTGLFVAMFDEGYDQKLSAKPPSGDLGPALTVSFVVPGPDNDADVVKQRLYPFAANGPVVYTAPDQSVFGTEKTSGGWFDVTPGAMDILKREGLPSRTEYMNALGKVSAEQSAPAAKVAADSSSALLTASIVVILLAAAGAAVMLQRRRTATGSAA